MSLCVRLLLSTGVALLTASSAYAERVVAIGDIHGDVGKLRDALKAAKLIDGADNWIGGDAQLVQTGDVVDRGPTSREAMDLLKKLEKAAPGKIHALVGNHEVLNVQDDLRYVALEEFAAFQKDEQAMGAGDWKQVLGEQLKSNGLPASLREAGMLSLNADKATPPKAAKNGKGWIPPRLGTTISCVMKSSSLWQGRSYWSKNDRGDRSGVSMRIDKNSYTLKASPVCPVGYWGHRYAFSPKGPYGAWIAEHDIVASIDGDLFMHGGISTAFAGTPVATTNQRAHSALVNGDRHEGVLKSENSGSGQKSGPTWYRCLEPEERAECNLPGITSVEAAEEDLRKGPELANMLRQQHARRIVMGHTVEGTGAIRSYGGGRAFFIDIGMAKVKGDALPAALEFEGAKAFAVYGPTGTRIELPSLPPEASLADYAREQEKYLTEVLKLYPRTDKHAKALLKEIARYQALEKNAKAATKPIIADLDEQDEKTDEAEFSMETGDENKDSQPPPVQGEDSSQAPPVKKNK